jgi:fatty acid desaturase
MVSTSIEWPTMAVGLTIYGSWIALTWIHATLPLSLLFGLGGLTVAWHGSFQHETIHGHPTGNRWIDGALGFAPLSLWLPYSIYHRTHLAHHSTSHITDPFDDPESHYCARSKGVLHAMVQLEASLAGRLILGPPIRVARFAITELGRLCRSPQAWMRDWLPHLAALAPLIWWLDKVDLPLGTYLMTFVYPGTALSLLRSFAEHRADSDSRRRAAIIRQPGAFGLLFLNNNLHAVHHAQPKLAWYRLPTHLARHRQAFEGGPTFQSYGEVARRFAFRPQDDIVHPDYRQTAEHLS